jgi:hypothetical protein
MLILMQDRCTVCTERTTRSESFFTHPMVLLGERGQVEARLSPFGDSVNLNER